MKITLGAPRPPPNILVKETEKPEREDIETVLLIHGTSANKHNEQGPDWWHRGSKFCHELDALLQQAGAAARCWAHLDRKRDFGAHVVGSAEPFAWTGENSEAARRYGGRALADQLQRLESDPRIARYHLIGHSHGGNVMLNALRTMPQRPEKLGAVIFLGTPVLSFRHRGGLDPRWVALPLYVAALIAAVWIYGHSEFWSVTIGLTVVAALLMEAFQVRSRSGRSGTSLYGSGRPSAFLFAGIDEAMISLRNAEQVTRYPKRFIEQFTQSGETPVPAVQPTSASRTSFSERLADTGAYRLIQWLRPPEPGLSSSQYLAAGTSLGGGGISQTLRPILEGLSSLVPLQQIVLILLWVLAALPLLLMLAAAAVYAFFSRHVGAAAGAAGLHSAKVLGGIALPRLVRKAAFGADQGQFIQLSDFPPEVTAHQELSPALLDEIGQIGRQYGQAAGRSMLDALQSEDAFAIKAQVTRALSDTALAHSHYYRSPEILARIAELIIEPAKVPEPPFGRFDFRRWHY